MAMSSEPRSFRDPGTTGLLFTVTQLSAVHGERGGVAQGPGTILSTLEECATRPPPLGLLI